MPNANITIPSNPLFINLTGKRFGRLVVMRYLGRHTRGKTLRAVWECRCDCQNIVAVPGGSLSGKRPTKSCGCLRGVLHTKHGHTAGGTISSEYRTWQGMMTRCFNTNNRAFPDYGGRGIEMCSTWRTFSGFLADMGTKPTPKHEIERRDNDKGYSPENCYWATRAEQARNTRATHNITFNGMTMCMKDWASHLGINYTTLHRRLKSNWPIALALTEPTGTLQRPNQKRLTWNRLSLTRREWAARQGLTKLALDHRLAAGWSLERALTQPLETRKMPPRA